jgi:hypothetical protein
MGWPGQCEEEGVLRILMLAALAAMGFWGVWPAVSGYQIHGALKDGDATTLGAKVDFERVRASLRPAVGTEVERRFGDLAGKAGASGLVLGDDLRKQLVPRLVDSAIATIVTPDNLIRIYRDGGAAKDAIGRMIGEQVGRGGSVQGALGKLGTLAAGGRKSPVRDITGETQASEALRDPAAAVLGAGRKSPVRDVTDEVAGAPASPPAAAPAPGASPVEKKPVAPAGYGLGNIKSFSFNGPLTISIGVAKSADAKEPDLVADISFTGTDWKLTGLRPRLGPL